MTQTLLVTGYSSFELGIFSETDPKLAVIKTAIRRHLEQHLENGLEWLIFTGALGFEYWVLQVALELRAADYPELQLATLFDFETHGANWNEANQLKLLAFKQVDFVKYSFPAYENPQQFRAHETFLIDNTDGALVLYDEENETKLQYRVETLRQIPNYVLDTIDFKELQEIASGLQEEEENFS